jgi:hypothetical protein
MVAGYLGVVSLGIIPRPVPLFWLFIVVVILFTSYDALQALRDLASGTALVQEDLLNRSYRTRNRQMGRFERLGSLRMTKQAYFQNSPGRRYRVVYSPVSKIVWALEPPEIRIRP